MGEKTDSAKAEEEPMKEEEEKEKEEDKKEEANAKPEDPKSKAATDEEDAENEALMNLLQDGQFARAAAEISKKLEKNPEDPVLLHNLGCVYTEEGKWPEAEEVFNAAFEAQKKAKTYNDATLFGLATVLTEQGGMGKLLQAEALFRDCLDRAIAQDERGILATYKSFQALGGNLGQQKRWSEAVEAYKQALTMGLQMFGEEHQYNQMGKLTLARAERLARIQKFIRMGLWAATAAVPMFCLWSWNYVGGPGVSELFSYLTGGGGGNLTAGGASDLPGLESLESLESRGSLEL